MNAAWNQVSSVHQQLFLQQTGLDELPAPADLTSAQVTALTGIVGESAVASIRMAGTAGTAAASASASSSLAEPTLSKPKTKGVAGDWSSIVMLVSKLQSDTSQLQVNAAAEGVMVTKDELALANSKQLSNINDSITQLEKSSNLSIWSKVLGWVGSIMGVIGAAVATVYSGGAAWPLLAVSCLGLAGTIASATGAMDTLVETVADWGAVEWLADKIGVEPELVVQIAIMAGMLTASIIAAVASGGISAGDTALKAAGFMQAITGAVLGLASSGVGIAKSVSDYKTANLKADSAEFAAFLSKLQAILSEQTESLEECVQRITQNMKDASETLSTIANSHKSITMNLGV